MSEIKQVKITDKTDKCYGMVGDVFDVDQSRLSGHARYYILIKGYNNCIKAGYTPEEIKRGKLDEVGFHRIVDADKCEVVDAEQIKNTDMEKDASIRKVAFTGQCTARYEYSSVIGVPSFVPPYREAVYIKEQIQSGDFSKMGIFTEVEVIPDFKNTDNCLIHYVGSPVYKNSVDIKRLYNKEITIVTHNEQEYEELKEILKQERGQNIDQCDTLNTDAKVYFHYWGNSIMDVDNELSDVSQEKLLDYSECDFVKNRDKWIQDYKKEIEEYENTHPIDELSSDDMERLTERNPAWIDDELYASACEPDDETIDAIYRRLKMYEDAEEQGLILRLPDNVGDVFYFAHHAREQELMELVQSLRKELTDAQETIEYLNDTIDNIHEQEMDELCEE